MVAGIPQVRTCAAARLAPRTLHLWLLWLVHMVSNNGVLVSLRILLADTGAAGAAKKGQNQEWPFAGVSHSP